MLLRAGIVLGILLSLAVPAAAQDSPPLAVDDGAAAPADLPGAEDLPNGTVPADLPGGLAIAPVLTVDQDQLFLQSAWGQRVQAELEADGTALQQENDRLSEQLAREEAELTELRKTLDAAEFRQRAEAFDTRATEVRRERVQAAADLNAGAEADRAEFYKAALPVIGRVMQERGAVAVLDRRTVFISIEAIDITDDLILRLDQELGAGAPPAGTPGADPATPQQ